MGDTVVIQKENPGCLVQLLWFVFIGWWVGQIWIALSWILILSIIGIPLAIIMLNRLPKVIALREPDKQVSVVMREGAASVSTTSQKQVNILVRAIYFVLIGWWLSAIWMELAYFVCLTLIGLPIGFWMFDRVPALVSLRR
ncbi:MAG: YccF domain-containing protein [Anaerolineales bacterium]